MRRLSALFFTVVLAGLVLALPVAAQYPPEPLQTVISVTTPEPGEPVALESTGWAGGTEVNIFLESTPRLLATVTTDAEGNLSTTVTIPDDVEPGAHTLRLVGTNADGTPREDAIPVAITAEGAGGGGSGGSGGATAEDALADTGSGLLTNGLLVMGVLAAGGVVLLLAARRRKAGQDVVSEEGLAG